MCWLPCRTCIISFTHPARPNVFFKSQTLRPQTIEFQEFFVHCLYFAGFFNFVLHFTAKFLNFAQVFSAEASDDMDTQQMKIWDRARGTQVEVELPFFVGWEEFRVNRLTQL